MVKRSYDGRNGDGGQGGLSDSSVPQITPPKAHLADLLCGAPPGPDHWTLSDQPVPISGPLRGDLNYLLINKTVNQVEHCWPICYYLIGLMQYPLCLKGCNVFV